MAYRRKHGITRAKTFKEEVHNRFDEDEDGEGDGDDINKNENGKFSCPGQSFKSYSFSPSNSSLAAQAIRASAAHRESSGLGRESDSDQARSKNVQGFTAYEDAVNDSKGFWGVLARKAKAILEDDNDSQSETSSRKNTPTNGAAGSEHPYQSNESLRRKDTPGLQKGIDKLTSSLNQIGMTFEKASQVQENRTMLKSKTSDVFDETRKLQQNGPKNENQAYVIINTSRQQNLSSHETQIKASRDVAVATAAKAKLLLRELKTVKADLTFAKERCAQLEEENKRLRESREKGSSTNPADDDLIRLQLETLLEEKARLAHENSIFARENRFLREIVEYHQLTMQDVVYIDEGIEEVQEINPSITRMLSATPPSPGSAISSSDEIYYVVDTEKEAEAEANANANDDPLGSDSSEEEEEADENDEKRPSVSSPA